MTTSVDSGIYVHIPFCLTRCGYCDFNTYADLGHLTHRYLAALKGELELVADQWTQTSFVSVFFGGGTPTTLPAADLAGLLDDLRAMRLDGGAEVTVEANPDTVDEGYLSSLLDSGVTRLSLGVQSLDPAVLRSLERIHPPQAACAAYVSARRAGFRAVNLDLIYGSHGESIDSWRRTLLECINLGPEHMSCYALTIEPATPLGRKVAAGIVPAPDPDVQAEMYDFACDTLASAGYVHYEVSNWAKPGFECVHNLGYWLGRPYLGLGAGAHSYREGRRWWNVRPPQQYIETVAARRPPVGGDEQLSAEQQRIERLLLGLRGAHGVPLAAVEHKHVDWLLAAGLARRLEDRLSPTERGMLVANDLVLELAGD